MPYLVKLTNQMGNFRVGFDSFDDAKFYASHMKKNHLVLEYTIKHITEEQKDAIIKENSTPKPAINTLD